MIDAPDQLAEAIEARRQLSFRYDGLPRIVIPAVYGYSTAGNLTLRAFQVGGLTRSPPAQGWRSFLVSKMSKCFMTEDGFSEVPPGYRRGDRGFSSILREL